MTKKEPTKKTKDIDQDELKALLEKIENSDSPPSGEDLVEIRASLQRGDVGVTHPGSGTSMQVQLGGIELPSGASYDADSCSVGIYPLYAQIREVLVEAGFDECQSDSAAEDIALACGNCGDISDEDVPRLTLWIEPGEGGVEEFLVTNDVPDGNDNPTPEEMEEAIAGFSQHLACETEDHMEWVDVCVMDDKEPPLKERAKVTWQSKGGGIKCFVPLHDEERRVLNEFIPDLRLHDFVTFASETPYVPERQLSVMEKIQERLEAAVGVLRTSRVEAFEEKHGSERRGMIFGMQRSMISCSAGIAQLLDENSIEFALGDFAGTIRQDVRVEPHRIHMEMFELIAIDAVKGEFGEKIREKSTVHRSVLNLTVDKDHAETCIPGLLKSAKVPVQHISLPWEGRFS